MEWIFAIILFGGVFIYKWVIETCFDAYDMSNIDDAKLREDQLKGVPDIEIKRRMIKGRYDKYL